MGKPTATASSPSHSYSNSIEKKSSTSDIRSPAKGGLGAYNTVPASSDRNVRDNFGLAGEFGEKKSVDVPRSYAAQTVGATNYAGGSGSRARAGSGASSYDNHGAVPAARPRSSNGRVTNPSQRLTIVNASEEEMKEHMEAEAERARRQPSTILESPISMTPPQGSKPSAPSGLAPKNSSSGLNAGWLSAEQEKELLYNRAVAKVKQVQGRAASPTIDVSRPHPRSCACI